MRKRSAFSKVLLIAIHRQDLMAANHLPGPPGSSSQPNPVYSERYLAKRAFHKRYEQAQAHLKNVVGMHFEARKNCMFMNDYYAAKAADARDKAEADRKALQKRTDEQYKNDIHAVHYGQPWKRVIPLKRDMFDTIRPPTYEWRSPTPPGERRRFGDCYEGFDKNYIELKRQQSGIANGNSAGGSGSGGFASSSTSNGRNSNDNSQKRRQSDINFDAIEVDRTYTYTGNSLLGSRRSSIEKHVMEIDKACSSAASNKKTEKTTQSKKKWWKPFGRNKAD